MELTTEAIFSGIIPAVLIFLLVFVNIRKMQKRAKMMRMEQEGKCGSGCAGCAHSKSCHSEKKD